MKSGLSCHVIQTYNQMRFKLEGTETQITIHIPPDIPSMELRESLQI